MFHLMVSDCQEKTAVNPFLPKGEDFFPQCQYFVLI